MRKSVLKCTQVRRSDKARYCHEGRSSYRSLEAGGTARSAGPHAETSGLVGGRGCEGISRARAFVVIFMRRAGQSGAGSFRLASLSNSGGLRSAGAAPSGLIAGPGAIRAGAGGSVDKGSGRGYWLWVGWCACETCACRSVVCAL